MRVVVLALAAMGLCAWSTEPALAQDGKATTETPWVKAAIKKISTDGLLVGYFDGLRWDRPPSRYETAVAAHAAYQMLLERLANLELLAGWAPDAPRTRKDRDVEGEVRDSVRRLGSWLSDVERLERLTAEFRFEIDALGVKIPEVESGLRAMRARIQKLQRQAPAILATVSDFPDSSANRWVYAALRNMKTDGLLTADTHPDLLPWPRIRFVFLVLHAYDRLRSITDELDARIKRLTAALDGNSSKEDLQKLRDELTALQEEVNAAKNWGDDIINLKKLVVFFTPEIRALGRDLELIKRDLTISSVGFGCYKPPLDIHSTWDVVGLAGTADGVTPDGRSTRGSVLLHEGSVSLASTNSEGVRGRMRVAFGDVLNGFGSGGFGNQSQIMPGERFRQGAVTAYLQEMAVQFDSCLCASSQSYELGRLGLKFGPYFLQRPDTTPLFDNERWDNGKWSFDGGIAEFHLSTAEVTAFGGFASEFLSGWTGDDLQPMRVGRDGGPWSLSTPSSRPIGLTSTGQVGMPVDEMYGVQIEAPIGDSVQLQYVGLWLDADRAGSLGLGKLYNRLGVTGGTLGISRGDWHFEAGLAGSTLAYNEHRVVDADSSARWLEGRYAWDRGRFTADYKEIGANFAAPGDWGRIGLWWNPTDLKGFRFGGSYDLDDHIEASLDGGWYSGMNDGLNDWGSGQKVDRYTARLKWHPSGLWDLSLGGEHVRYRGLGGPEPTEQWLTFGATFGIDRNSRFKATWQTGRVSADGAPAFRIAGREVSTGGLFVGQWSYRF